MRRLIASLLILISLWGCAAAPEPTVPSQPPEASAVTEPEPVRGFRVAGTQLLDANGEPFLIRGVNHPHSWFPEKDEAALRAMAELGCNAVRIVCGCGILYPEDTAQDLIRLTDLCRELGMVVILEVHDITGDDLPASLEQVVDYWIRVREALTGREEWVIVNIANEWKSQRSGRNWSLAYISQIPRLREAGIRNTLLVDVAGGGQYGTSLTDFGAAVLEADPDRNVFFSLHIYHEAGKSRTVMERELSAGPNAGLCVAVGEFGPAHLDRDIDEAYLMEYCHREGIGYLGWSWMGNAAPNEALDLAKAWDGSSLTPWGELLFHGPCGIGETAERCTVFRDR